MLTNVDLGVRKKGLCAFWSVISVCFLTSFSVFSQQRVAQLKTLWYGDTSLVFRGISALSDDVIWASSNQGVVVKTEDGGINWTILKIPGAEGIQFRDIHLFNEKTALIMGSGWPTRIYKTLDAGLNWRLVYENNDSAVFLDGFDFWPDGSGLCFGDPVDGKFFLLKTDDEGEHWYEINGPRAIDGEAGFAASGTSIICYLDVCATFVSGGSRSSAYYTIDRGEELWLPIPLKITSGSTTQGAFSLAYSDDYLIYVGGDYANDRMAYATAERWDYTESQELPQTLDGLPFQSAAAWYNKKSIISVGTPGCFFSLDAGLTWQKFTEIPLHTITKSRNGTAAFAAGPKGRIVKIIIE
jgi:photosystem II stability/assembly factor-like uncharacterized protein